jgi:hypothetical protein
MNEEIRNILHRPQIPQLSFTYYKHVKRWGVSVNPQLSAGKRPSININYIVAHNFQQISKKIKFTKDTTPHQV